MPTAVAAGLTNNSGTGILKIDWTSRDLRRMRHRTKQVAPALDPACGRDDKQSAKNRHYIVSNDAKVTIAFQRLSSLRFSFSLCWLLSKLTTGTAMIGNPNVSANGAIGTVPPMVRMRTGGSPQVLCIRFVISTAAG